MVRSAAQSSAPDSALAVFQERVRVLTTLYETLNGLMRGWAERAEGFPDGVQVAVTRQYQAFSADLFARVAEARRDGETGGMDASALQDAYDHLRAMQMFDAERVIASIRDVEEGRVISLEQARRELQGQPR